MRKRSFLIGTFAILFSVFSAKNSRAANWQLISQDDVDRERLEGKAAGQLPSPIDASPTAGEPTIDIKQPDLRRMVKVPVTISIVFSTEADAKIVPSSFRAVYGGFIRLDITDKIKAHAKLDETGLFAEGVTLPSGKHRVTISIADSRGRNASRTLEFTVA